MGKNTEAAKRQLGGGQWSSAAANSTSYSNTVPCRRQPAHGVIHGDTWQKSVRASVHMLRAPRGWALDEADLDIAERAGAVFVHLHDLEQLRSYWAAIAEVRRGFLFDRGHGRQIALPLDRWAATREQAEALTAPQDGEAQQLGLWAGVLI